MSLMLDNTPVEAGLSLCRPLLPEGIALAGADRRDPAHRVLPEEAGAIASAVPSRRAEFAAGRTAARAAMQALGVEPRPVPMAADRAPIWPRALTGSITHTGDLCLAAVARRSDYRSLGIDAEPDTPLDPDLIPTICTPAERAWLSTLPGDQAGRMAKLIFSAKECAYKCQYSVTHTLFGFEMFEVTPDPASGQFEATFTADVGPFSAGELLTGRYGIGHGLIVTAMALGA